MSEIDTIKKELDNFNIGNYENDRKDFEKDLVSKGHNLCELYAEFIKANQENPITAHAAGAFHNALKLRGLDFGPEEMLEINFLFSYKGCHICKGTDNEGGCTSENTRL